MIFPHFKVNLLLKNIVVCTISFLLAIASPVYALASVLPTDEILGETAEQKQLSVAQCPNVDAKNAILVDIDGNVLYSRDAFSSAKIASVTKVMTAIVALENSSLSDKVIISAEAAQIGESSAELKEGDVLDMESALKALLVPSGNDAAVAIAETVGKKLTDGSDTPLQAFVNQMNIKANSLGCADTIFTNPHGLDDEEFAGDLHSTASDVSIICRYALTNNIIRSIVSAGSTSISIMRDGASETIELETTDMMLEMYKYTIGIKTGNTEAAGPCFASAISRNGKELYAIVLNSSSEIQRFYDCIAIYDWYFEHLYDYSLCNTNEYLNVESNGQYAKIPVVAHVAHADWLNKTFSATFSNTNLSVEVFDLNGNVSQDFDIKEIHGSVKAGDIIGTATFYQHNEEIASVDIMAAEDCAAPNPLESIGIWFSRLLSGFTGSKTVAETTIVNTTPLIVDKTVYSN